MRPARLDMALGALGWGARDLAKAAKVSLDTFVRFRRGAPIKERALTIIRPALESAGVEFIAKNGGGTGVRLRKGADG